MKYNPYIDMNTEVNGADIGKHIAYGIVLGSWHNGDYEKLLSFVEGDVVHAYANKNFVAGVIAQLYELDSFDIEHVINYLKQKNKESRI